MSEIRVLFGTTLVDIGAWLGEQRAELAKRFDGPSALAEFSVRGLAGHLRRAMTVVLTYLDQSSPSRADGDAITAAEYYAGVLPADGDLNSEFNRTIRQRGLEAAPGVADDFAPEWAETAAEVVARLDREPGDRLVQVYGGLVLTLDDYPVTRLVELVVHADDLAVSLDAAPPELPDAATALVIATLVEIARLRHGDTAVVRALTRRERDAVGALRVI
jgi:Mycothiol maleylpyruvate isomerase N-terminal domain